MVKKIIVNFPTNLGDAIIGLPVLDRLRANYPQAGISLITSSQTHDFFMRNSHIDETIFFDKTWKLRAKIKFCRYLRGKYDLIADLKNSFLPVALGIAKRTPFFRPHPKNLHVSEVYLRLLDRIAPKKESLKGDFFLTDKEKNKWQEQDLEGSLFIACSSRSELKQYPYAYLKEVVTELKRNYPIAILGEERDRQFYKDILAEDGVRDLVGKTTLAEAFYLFKNFARSALCVDSGLMHMASYVDLPVVAIFLSTDPRVYGPWSRRSLVIKNKNPSSVLSIRPQEVISTVKTILTDG